MSELNRCRGDNVRFHFSSHAESVSHFGHFRVRIEFNRKKYPKDGRIERQGLPL
jgi:hypothetical protein